MNAIDTNVLLYRFDDHEPVKQAKAVALLQRLGGAPVVDTVLLWQAGVELLAQLYRWARQGRSTQIEARARFEVVRKLFPIQSPREPVIDLDLDLTDRYSLSHWDSLIVAACLDAGIDTLYTEDMGAPTTYDGLELVNPFV